MNAILQRISDECVKAYAGINDIAKPVYGIYVGENNRAKELYKYNFTLSKGTNAEQFPYVRYDTTMTHLGSSYAIISGGVQSSNANGSYGNITNGSVAYTVDGTITNIEALALALRYPVSINLGDSYALVTSGVTDINADPYMDRHCYNGTITVYNKYLTKTTLNGTSEAQMAAVSFNGYALFAGGGAPANIAYFGSQAEAYDEDLTRTDAQALAEGVASATGCAIGNMYGLIAGGTNNAYMEYGNTITHYQTNTINAYDANLTRTNPTTLTAKSEKNTGVECGSRYALICGGNGYDRAFGWTFSRLNIVDAVDASLIRSSAPTLSSAKNLLTGAKIGDSAMFAGGLTDSGAVNDVEVYNTQLVKSAADPLDNAVHSLYGTNVGYKTAIIGLGYTGSQYSKLMNRYVLT